MSKLKLDVEFKTLEGEPVKGPGGSNLNLRTACITSLLTPGEGDKSLSGDKKYERFKLSQTIHNAKEDIELKAEDKALLKKLIGEIYLPLIVGQAFDMLDA